MPKVFKVEKAFLSTEQDKKTPQIVNTQGGPMHRYMVQFENQSIPGWVSILKKPVEGQDGKLVQVGDEMYGVLEENQWGKAQFTRMQLPQDGSVKLAKGGSPAPQKSESKDPNPPTDDINGKLDYIIGLLENSPQFRSSGSQPKSDDVVLEDIDDGPVDLSDIPY